jgi:hypothetical protein
MSVNHTHEYGVKITFHTREEVDADGVVVSKPFTDEDTGLPFNPTVVTLRFEKPDETIEELVHGTDPDMDNEDVGVYVRAYLPTQSGTWHWAYIGSGNCDTRRGGTFRVKEERPAAP